MKRKCNPPYRWTVETEALLGTMPDVELGQQLGIKRRIVGYRRRQLDIPIIRQRWQATKAFRDRIPSWLTSERKALLGVVADRELARRWGRSFPTVGKYRRKLGISPIKRGSGRKYEWSFESDALLGTVSDAKVGKLLGISKSVVGIRRRMLGISVVGRDKEISRIRRKKKKRFYTAHRKQLKEGILDTLTIEQWLAACEWFGNCCAYCGKRVSLSEDHVIPLTKGGIRTVGNIIPVCKSCNSSKGIRPLCEWACEKFGLDEGKNIVDGVEEYLETHMET